MNPLPNLLFLMPQDVLKSYLLELNIDDLWTITIEVTAAPIWLTYVEDSSIEDKGVESLLSLESRGRGCRTRIGRSEASLMGYARRESRMIGVIIITFILAAASSAWVGGGGGPLEDKKRRSKIGEDEFKYQMGWALRLMISSRNELHCWWSWICCTLLTAKHCISNQIKSVGLGDEEVNKSRWWWSWIQSSWLCNKSSTSKHQSSD